MEEIKAPKKERKFLKAIGNIGKVLAEELVMGIARKFIGKVVDKVKLPKKRETLSLLLLLWCSIAFAQFPSTGNKQRLGFQTTADGLVWRGALSDTASIQPVNNQNAWLIVDTINLKIYSFDFTSNNWNLVSGGTSGLTMPFDSITFNTAKDGTVGVGEVEYNDTQGSLIQGLKGGNVTNVIGQQLHQRVNNRTGATLAKGTAVYLSGSQGNRITVAKALGVTDAFSASTFGIVAESIADNQSGYVITEGLITNINTSALTEDSAVYLSPLTAGTLTSTKPQAPQHTVYIGVCVKSNAGSGELFVKIRNGQELDELHDVRITSPVNKASLYYLSSQGVWRDTTAALLVSDTSSMLSNYALKSYADTSGRFYARQDFRNVSTSTLTWTQTDTLVVNDTTSLQVYRNGQILLPSQYTVPTKTTIVIGATAYKLGENYTVIFPRGGGGGGSGSGSLTSISGGTGITVSPNPITTTGTVSADLTVLMELTDTTLLNLTTRFATKQNNITLTTTGTSGAATFSSNTLNIPQYSGGGSGTVTSVGSGYGLLGGPITTTGTLRVDTSTVYDFVRDSIVAVEIGGDTIKIIKQEYENVTSDTLTFTILPKFPIQLRQYILLFRNGQLLLNDQFTVIDTNKVKIAATSYKIGENYTLVTVSGIGSVSSGQSNPIYPEAGIALSTGTTWTTSITNNSSNWNTAYTDRLKWDGGSTGIVASTGRTSLGGSTIGQSMFTLTNPSAITFPQFNVDNSISALSAALFRSAIGAGTVTSVTASSTAGNPISIANNTTTPTIELLSATTGRNGYLTSTDWTTFNNKQNDLGFTPANNTITISTTAPLQGGGNLTANRTLSITQATTSANGFLTNTDWNTFNNKVNISDTSTMLSPYFRDADTTLLNLTTRFAAKQNNITLTTTGTSGAATLIGATLNIPQYSGGGGGTGTVTSVGLTAPSIFSVGGSPVTTSGTLALTYSGTALPLLNGGTGATTADGALTNLGATAQGKLLFGLTNTVSEKFIKVNTNNTITLLNAADTRSAIGATTLGSNLFTLSGIGTISFAQMNANNTVTLISDTQLKNVIGAGSVSSVDMTVPSFLSVSGNPVTSSGTLSVSLSGVPLPVLNGGTGGANASDARNELGAACKSCTETLTGNKTFSSDIIVNGINIGKGASSIATNTRVGIGALSSITTGVNNTAIGNGSGDLITTGESNTFLGSDAGFIITTGSYNTVIGHNSRPSANNSTLQLVVGHNLLGKGNSTAYIGGASGAFNEKNVTTWETTSDIRLKKNIKFYDEGLNKINQIVVKNYEYKTKEEVIDSFKSSVIARKGIQIGVIAQEYQKIFPESVSTNSTGILSINTDNLIWHLVNSVKELSNELKILKLEIENLKKDK
jgi:hypothetical protein